MAVLREVWVWPTSGVVGRAWLEDPDEEAFARSAVGVCALYSEAVRAAKVGARHSELRLNCHRDAGRDDVLVMVYPEERYGPEMAVVSLPAGIAGMTPAARGRLALDVVHAAAMRLGRARGWDADALVEAYGRVIAAGLRYRWDGPAKVSPDRRHVAHAAYVIGDDGHVRVSVTIRRRADGTVVSSSAPVVLGGGPFGLARHAATVRWRSRTRVELQPSIVVEVSGPVSAHTAPEYHDTSVELGIVTLTPAELGPRIEVIGGGPMNGVPGAYPRILTELLEQPELTAWWSGTGGAKVLEVWWDFAATTAGVSARRGGDTMKVTIRRPVSTFGPGRDPAALARDDFEALLATVRRRVD